MHRTAAVEQVIGGVNEGIGGGAAPVGAQDTAIGQRISKLVANGVADASRPAVAFAGLVVTIGALNSLLVPNIPPDGDPAAHGRSDQETSGSAAAS